MRQFDKVTGLEREEQPPLKFVMLPDKLPSQNKAYQRARYAMYQAQLRAAEIAAQECWPEDYQEAKRLFQERLLGLFSQECTSYRK